MNATTQTAPTARTVPVLADTIRLTKGDAEIVFVFSDGSVQVHDLTTGEGAPAFAVWRHEVAAAELVMRLRLGWQLVPVVAG